MPGPELLTRGATIEPRTFDPERRTVRVTWSTGAAVLRRDAQGPYAEILSLDPEHVRLDHLPGAPVLDSHKQRDLGNVLGTVERAGIEAGAGWADVRFSSRAEVAPVVEDVRAGVIRHVSIGYSVARWLDGKDPKTGGRTRTAIDWTPREISFVPLPADPGATVRSHMDAQNTPETPAETAEGGTGDRAEVNRHIRGIAAAAGLGAAWADGLIDRAATLDEARAAGFDEMLRRCGGTIHTRRAEVLHGADDPAVQLRHMQDALVARMMPGAAPGETARPFVNLGLVEMARHMLRARGERVGTASREEVLHRAMHTTSDFPNLLTGAGNRVLMAAYEAAPNPLKALARRTTLADFRPKTALRLSDLPKLPRVTEAGEIKHVTRTEARESYSLETYGEIFALSRKAIINDDLGAFQDYAAAMGRAAAETEADQLVQALLGANGNGPAMSDGKRLFAPEHGNLAATGSALSVAALSDARQALRTMRGVDGKTPVNATPRFLLVGPALETLAEQLLAALTAGDVAQVNPFGGKLVPLVEPRLPPAAWYVFADPAVMPVLEYAHLSSAQGPQIATREGWDTLGMEFRCVLDFGCGAVDWRGAYRNPGA